MSLTMRVREVETSGISRKVSAATEAALGILAENALSDCRPYVPYGLGALQGSGKTNGGADGHATIEWGGTGDTSRYAREQYYNPHDHATSQNALYAPKATDHWFEHARAERMDAWIGLYKRALKGGL
jgi:hypothetical protein